MVKSKAGQGARACSGVQGGDLTVEVARESSLLRCGSRDRGKGRGTPWRSAFFREDWEWGLKCQRAGMFEKVTDQWTCLRSFSPAG